MKFRYEKAEKIPGHTTYVTGDKALDFEQESVEKQVFDVHAEDIREAALIINKTVQLEFDTNTGRLLFVWGYCPMEVWKVRHEELVFTQDVVQGAVYVSGVSEGLMPGTGYDTDLSSANAIFYETSNVLVVGEHTAAERIVEIAEKLYIGLKGENLSFVSLGLLR